MALVGAALLSALILQSDGATTRRWVLPDLDFEESAAVVARDLAFSAIGDPASPVGAPWTPAAEGPIRGASLVDFELDSGGTWLVTASGVERLFLDGCPVPIVGGDAIPFPVVLEPGTHRVVLVSAGEARWSVARPDASVVSGCGRADIDPSSPQTWYWAQVGFLLVNTTRAQVLADVSYGPLVSSNTPGPWSRGHERAGSVGLQPLLPASVSVRGKIAQDNAAPAPKSKPMLPLRISGSIEHLDVDVAIGPLAELELLGRAGSRVWLIEPDPLSSGARGLARHDAFLLVSAGREIEMMSEEAYRTRRTRPGVVVFYGEPELGEPRRSGGAQSGFAVQARSERGAVTYVLSAASDPLWTLGVGWMAGRG